MVHAARPRLSAVLRFLLLLVLSLASLVAGALIGSDLGRIPRIAAGLAGFGGYLILFGRAMRRLPVDWDQWLDRNRHGFRSTAERAPAAPGRAA